MARVKICPSLIPDVELRVLFATGLDSVQAFYENPENLKRFEAWKRKKEEKVNVGNQSHR